MVQAVSGLMSLTGPEDGPPYRAGISMFDVMAGKDALIGILAALRHRDATGRGQHVELSLLPYEPLPTADNDIVIAAANDGLYRKVCQVLGVPELADDPRFVRNADR